jgi:hypothetical protein
MLERLQTWGRVAGYFKRFQKSLGCEPKGLREIQVDVIRHETSNGAQQYAEWARESDQSISDRLQDISVGDYGYQFWFDDQSNCETSNTERAAGILFRRANDLGQVYVYAAKGALTDDELMAQALKLARSIDRKLANVASN